MPVIYTVGHSTRPLEEMLNLLRAHQITHLVDVRTVPRSRTNPQFNRDAFPTSLAEVDIAYTHMPGLGGLRKPRADSINIGWKNASFRGYADYMQTEDFAENLSTLMGIARAQPTAIMCAEAVPWRCHRSLIADALTVRGWDVLDILSAAKASPHRLTKFAVVVGDQLTYPLQAANSDL